MAKQQSSKCRFESKYGAGFVTDAQYLAEFMCVRMGKKDKKDLPMKFWNTSQWKRPFLLQLQHANALLKVYAVEAVLRALRSRKGSRLYSLGAKQMLLPLVQAEQEAYAKELEALNAATDSSDPGIIVGDKSPRPSRQGKPNLLSKLRDIDGEEESDDTSG